MALPLVPALVAAVSGLFFRRVTTTDAEGNESERRKARPVPAALFALLVRLVMSVKLKKINMSESLKSVE